MPGQVKASKGEYVLLGGPESLEAEHQALAGRTKRKTVGFCCLALALLVIVPWIYRYDYTEEEPGLPYYGPSPPVYPTRESLGSTL